MEQWVECFLYRGRPPSGPGSDLPRTFQVEIGQQVADPFDPSGPPSRRVTLPMTPEQAASAGFHLSDLVEGINASAVEENANLANEIADLKSKLADAESLILTKTGEIQSAGKRIENLSLQVAVAEAQGFVMLDPSDARKFLDEMKTEGRS